MIEVMNKNVTALSKGIANYAQSNEQGFWRFKPDIAKKESSGLLRNDDGMFCIWTKPKEEYFYSSESGSESGSESDKQSVEEKTQENKKTTPPPDKQLVEEKTQENKKRRHHQIHQKNPLTMNLTVNLMTMILMSHML
jgi:hypothetical protein